MKMRSGVRCTGWWSLQRLLLFHSYLSGWIDRGLNMFHLLLLPLLYALRLGMLDYAEDRLATCQLQADAS